MSEVIKDNLNKKIYNYLENFQKSQLPSKTISYHKDSVKILQRLFGFLYGHSAVQEYWKDRNANIVMERKFHDALKHGEEIIEKVLIEGDSIAPHCSFTAKTHLLLSSDVDIYLLVKDCNEEKKKYYVDCLKINGFEHDNADNDGGYVSYSKMVNDIELEIKIRDKDAASETIALHRYIENLPEEDIQCITYIKAITHLNNELYLRFKKIMYSGFYTMMKDGEKNKSLL